MTTGTADRHRTGDYDTPTRLHDLSLRIGALVKVGKVIDFNGAQVRVRVGFGARRTLVTGWLNWSSLRAGYDREAYIPELGEQVVILSPNGRVEAGFVLCSLRQIAHPHPNLDPNARVTLFRILEGTNHWAAMEERRAVGDVNPEEKRQNFAEPLPVRPAQDKVLNSSTAVAEVLAYHYRTHIRPELIAVMDFVSATTHNNGTAKATLAATSIRDGQATTLLDSSVGGQGNAYTEIKTATGRSYVDYPSNPKKPQQIKGAGGDAVHTTSVQTLAAGNATCVTDVESSAGGATHTINVEASGAAAVNINLSGGSTVYTINVGSEQTLTMNGTLLRLKSSQVLFDCDFIKFIGEMLLDGNLSVTKDVNDKVRTMAADRTIYNAHEHPVSGGVAKPTPNRQ